MKALISILFSACLFCVTVPLATAEDASASYETVNVNSADLEALSTLKGIGQAKAEAIIAWREDNGDFVSVDQLVEVKGIGEATIEANRDVIRTE